MIDKLIKILMIPSVFTNDFNCVYDNSEDDVKYMYNNKVNDSLLYIYLFLISSDEEHLNKSYDIFNKLDEEEKEYVRRKILKDLKLIDENQKKKEKKLKKEND